MKNFTENINNLNNLYEENEDINIYLMEFISKNKKGEQCLKHIQPYKR